MRYLILLFSKEFYILYLKLNQNKLKYILKFLKLYEKIFGKETPERK